MKICSKCKEVKNLDQFGIRHNSKCEYYDSWCKECYRKNAAKHKRKIGTNCKVCGKEELRWEHGIAKWSGLCRKCSNKEVANRIEVRLKKSIDAKAQIIKQGGIPNAVKFSKVAKELHPHWNGGLPKCVDCGKELSTYNCKRCVPCLYKFRTKQNHWNWQGGKSDENYRIRHSSEYKNWRKEVFKRDKWTCILCGYRSKSKSDIRADHIKPFHLYPELRLEVSNGRTLCLCCDRVYGYNYNRDKSKYEFLN